MRISNIVTLACATLAAGVACAQSPANTNKPAVLDRTAAKALIEQLVSPNKDPNPKSEPFVVLPMDYDHKAQQRVDDARLKLLGFGKDAFPFLIESLGDQRYARPISTSVLRSCSVADVCFMIISEQVDLAEMNYKARVGPDGKYHGYRSYFAEFSGGQWYTKKAVETWWEQNRQRSLAEMQTAALRWSIEREQKIGFADQKARDTYLAPLLAKLSKVTQPPPEGAPRSP